MKAGFGAWLAGTGLVVLAGVVVPYRVLTGLWSVPLFWLGFGLVIAVLILAGTRGWRDDA